MNILQEAILRAFRGFDTLRGPMRAWLLRSCAILPLDGASAATAACLGAAAGWSTMGRTAAPWVADTPDPESTSIQGDEQRRSIGCWALRRSSAKS